MTRLVLEFPKRTDDASRVRRRTVERQLVTKIRAGQVYGTLRFGHGEDALEVPVKLVTMEVDGDA